MAHTPGPWVAKSLEPHTIGGDWVDGPDRKCLAVCGDVVGNGPHGYCVAVDTDEIAANARLIAAAPDLLAACKAQHDAIDMLFAMLIARSPPGDTFHPSKSGALWDACVAGSAAILKAEGG